MDKVDVVILTKNSASTLKYVLNGVLNSIPVNNLIIVDGNSTDGTLTVARQFGAKIIEGSWNLASARYQGVLEVETEWFCFIDSDMYIFPSWYKQLQRLRTGPKVAWIQGLTLEHSRILSSYATSKTLRFAKYGCVALSNSLLQRKPVLECRNWLRADIHAGEDSILYRFFKAQGYRVILDSSALCLHLPDCFFHDIYALYRAGYSDRLRGKHIPIVYLGVPVQLLEEGLIRVLLTKDPRLAGYFALMLGTSYVLGYFGPAKDQIRHLMQKIDQMSKPAEMYKLIDLERKRETKLKQFTHVIEV